MNECNFNSWRLTAAAWRLWRHNASGVASNPRTCSSRPFSWFAVSQSGELALTLATLAFDADWCAGRRAAPAAAPLCAAAAIASARSSAVSIVEPCFSSNTEITLVIGVGDVVSVGDGFGVCVGVGADTDGSRGRAGAL